MKKVSTPPSIEGESDRDDLPEGWAQTTLSEICFINPPKPAREALRPDARGTFVPMPTVDADLGAITNADARPFSEVRKGYTAFRDGDVIMAKITPCMENGKAAIARNLENGLGFGSTEFHVLRPRAGVLADFVYHFIRQESYRRAAESEMTGSVGQKRVTTHFMVTTSIPLAPHEEQRRIITTLTELVAKTRTARDRLEAVPKILKAFRKSVLTAACSGRLTEDWRNLNPEVESAEVLVDKIKYHRANSAEGLRAVEPVLSALDELDGLPAKWCWIQFGSVIGELRNGISTKPQQEPVGNPILRISSVRSGTVLLEEVRYLPSSSELIKVYCLRDGDLLFTRYNGSLDLLGVCGMVRGLGKGALLYPDKLMRVRIDHPYLLPPYTEVFFQAPSSRDRLTAKSKSSAGQQGISGTDVKAQPLALPPLEEQREIVRRVAALFKLADKIEERVTVAAKRVDKVTQAVLAKAFRGELVPTEAELASRDGRSYEPASVLLERIRSERSKTVGSHRNGVRKSIRA